MYRIGRDLKARKTMLMIFTISILLVITMSVAPVTTFANADALDLLNFEGIDDIGQSTDCVIVVIGCDGQGSVGSAGDVVIESGNNNGNGNNGVDGDQRGTLTVTVENECWSLFGFPDDVAVCDYTESSPNWPDPSIMTVTVFGNDPNPSVFEGSSTGTEVTIGPGDFNITGVVRDQKTLEPLFDELGALKDLGLARLSDARGDCNYDVYSYPQVTGTMTPGESQECTLINQINIIAGVVPGTYPSDIEN
jgi:hypothetical protein